MKWIFISTDVLTELDSGFTIRLLAGTWASPIEIRPDKTTVKATEQARLLRLGLAYAINFEAIRIAS